MIKTLVYIRRSVKFLVALFVLYIAAMWIMSKTGATDLTAQQMAVNLVRDGQSIALLCAVALWAAVYPAVSFVERRIEADTEADRERIENAFIRSGYEPAGTDAEGRLLFRKSNFFGRLRLLFEDKITVEQYGQWVVLKGIRRSVSEVEMRLNTYMQNAKRNEKEQ